MNPSGPGSGSSPGDGADAEIRGEWERQALAIQWREVQIRLEGERRRQETELALMRFAGTVLPVVPAVAILIVAYGATIWMVAQARRTAAIPPAARQAPPPTASPDRLVSHPHPAGTARPAYAAASEPGDNGMREVDFPRPPF